MKSVLLRLEGPLQAWGTQSKLGIRATDREPSKSGVLGLIGAALGMERDDDAMLASLRSLELAVRIDRAGLLLRDFHTAGGGRFRGRDYVVFGASDCIPSARYYLQDASFVVALSGDDGFVERIGGALQSPRWPLFLGRRACPPSEPVFHSLIQGRAASTVRSAPLSPRRDPGALRLVVEAFPGDGDAEPRYDVPLSFADGARHYTSRYVRNEWLTTDAGDPAPPQPSAAKDDHR